MVPTFNWTGRRGHVESEVSLLFIYGYTNGHRWKAIQECNQTSFLKIRCIPVEKVKNISRCEDTDHFECQVVSVPNTVKEDQGYSSFNRSLETIDHHVMNRTAKGYKNDLSDGSFGLLDEVSFEIHFCDFPSSRLTRVSFIFRKIPENVCAC